MRIVHGNVCLKTLLFLPWKGVCEDQSFRWSHSPRGMRCGTEDLSRLLLLQHKLQGTYYERPSQHMLSVTCVERLSQS